MTKKPKLVRDKLVPRHGTEVKFARDRDALRLFLCAKLIEESQEAVMACTREQFIEEIADIAEVIETLMSLDCITQQELREAKDHKRAEKGGFSRGQVFIIERTN